MANTSSYWSLSRHCCITALWQKHPLIGYSLNNAAPSHCQHCYITLSLAKTSSYCGHYLKTVTSPSNWQKHPLIGHSLNNAVRLIAGHIGLGNTPKIRYPTPKIGGRYP